MWVFCYIDLKFVSEKRCFSWLESQNTELPLAKILFVLYKIKSWKRNVTQTGGKLYINDNKKLYRAFSQEANQLILNISVFQGLLRVYSKVEKHA